MFDHCKGWAVMHLPENFRPLFYRPITQQVDGVEKTVMEKVTFVSDMMMKWVKMWRGRVSLTILNCSNFILILLDSTWFYFILFYSILFRWMLFVSINQVSFGFHILSKIYTITFLSSSPFHSFIHSFIFHNYYKCYEELDWLHQNPYGERLEVRIDIIHFSTISFTSSSIYCPSHRGWIHVQRIYSEREYWGKPTKTDSGAKHPNLL